MEGGNRKNMKKKISLIIILLVAILNPITVNAQETAKDTLIKTVTTTNDGLYQDEYEEGRYIYRGVNPNNYITFNNETAGWRILSVEKDGTIKIVRDKNIGSVTFDSQDRRDKTSYGKGGTYCSISFVGCNFWAPNTELENSPQLIYNGSNSGTVLLYSEVAELLNNTYYESLTEEAKKYITENIFNVGPAFTSDLTENASYEQIKLNIKSEKIYQWKGKVGLATFSEYLRTKEWIFNNEPSMTITPEYNSSDYIKVANAPIDYGNNKNVWAPAYTKEGGGWLIYTYPVLYLKSSIMLSGEGTVDNPYTITAPVKIKLETFGDLEKELIFRLETTGKTLNEIKEEINNQIGTEVEQDGKVCTLDSWYLDKDLKTKFDEETPINNNLTLFGRWECREIVNVPNTLLQIPRSIITLGCGLIILGIGIIIFIIRKKKKINGGIK